MVVALPTNWNPSHAPTAAELAQVLAAIRVGADRLKFATGLTSNSASITTETMVSSAATSFVWEAGRAYRVVITGGLSGTGNPAVFKLKRGTTTGSSTLADMRGFWINGGIIHLYEQVIIKNATGSNIVQTVQPSLSGAAGGVVWDGGTVPRGWYIEDFGEATDVGTLGVQI